MNREREEETEAVSLRLPKRLLTFLRAWKGLETEAYLENTLIDAIKGDFDYDGTWREYFIHALKQHNLEDFIR